MSRELVMEPPGAVIDAFEATVCVHRHDPPLRVAGLVLEAPAIVQLHLEVGEVTGRAYAWTLNEADARLLERGLVSVLQSWRGTSAALSDIVGALDQALPAGLHRQRARTLAEGALVDAELRRLGQSLAAALDIQPRPIKVYASDMYDSQDLDAVAAMARAYVDEGFPGVKIRLGRRDAPWARERLLAVREAVGPDAALMVDAVQGWDLEFCWRMMPSLTDAGLTWLEDPFHIGDDSSLADLARWSSVPICTGESATQMEQIEVVIAAGADIVMLDIQHLGGLGPTLRAMDLVINAGRRLTFHVFPDLAATLGAGAGVEWVEWAPLWGGCGARPKLVDGCAEASEQPGTGISGPG